MKFVKVKANKRWLEGGGIPCADLGRVPKPGEEWIVTELRAKELVAKGRTSIVEVIDEPAKEIKDEPILDEPVAKAPITKRTIKKKAK